MTAAGTGAYQLQLDPGAYVVCEVAQAGWFQSHPGGANATRCQAGAGLGKAGHDVTVTSGSSGSGQDCSNFPAATGRGRKVWEANADGDDEAGGDAGKGGFEI